MISFSTGQPFGILMVCFASSIFSISTWQPIDDGLNKVKQGEISLEELLRVIGED